MEGDDEINCEIDYGEIDREDEPLFDHEVSAYQYNSFMDKLETLKEDKEIISNF